MVAPEVKVVTGIDDNARFVISAKVVLRATQLELGGDTHCAPGIWGFWRQRDDGVRLMARNSSPETTVVWCRTQTPPTLGSVGSAGASTRGPQQAAGGDEHDQRPGRGV